MFGGREPYPHPVMYRLALTSFLLLALAAPAAAADVSLSVSPSRGLQLGGEHKFSGTLSQSSSPLAGHDTLDGA